MLASLLFKANFLELIPKSMTENISQDEQLGAAIGAIPAGLFILTSQQNDKTGTMLASWVQQAGFNPPSITFAIAKGRAFEEFVTVGSPIMVNIAAKGDGKIIGHFAKGFAPDVDPFAGVEIGTAASGQNYINSAIAYLDTTVTDSFDAGDHRIVLATIHSGAKINDGESAVHIRKNGFKY